MKTLIQPTLSTERLSLRPFVRSDSAEVQRLAGDERIAAVTANIPHPYPDGLAESWISKHQPGWEAGNQASFAVVHKSGDCLVGAISLAKIADGSAEVGYWFGVDYWGKGFATETCRVLFNFAREDLQLKRLHATVLIRNPASSHVLQKAGMQYIGQYVGACGEHHANESIAQYELIFAAD